jgi:hypothetical protein
MIGEAERADTRMMGIAHGALRRDLLRTRDALTAEPYPRGRQRQALGEHVGWMMEFLHAMPVVEGSITRARWHAVEQKYNIKPKSLAQLGMEGHWLLDGIDPEGYQVVVHTVPAVPRFILLHGFARAYRRRALERWQPGIQAERAAAR